MLESLAALQVLEKHAARTSWAQLYRNLGEGFAYQAETLFLKVPMKVLSTDLLVF